MLGGDADVLGDEHLGAKVRALHGGALRGAQCCLGLGLSARQPHEYSDFKLGWLLQFQGGFSVQCGKPAERLEGARSHWGWGGNYLSCAWGHRRIHGGKDSTRHMAAPETAEGNMMWL